MQQDVIVRGIKKLALEDGSEVSGWQGTAKQLMSELRRRSKELGIDPTMVGWPKSSKQMEEQLYLLDSYDFDGDVEVFYGKYDIVGRLVEGSAVGQPAHFMLPSLDTSSTQYSNWLKGDMVWAFHPTEYVREVLEEERKFRRSYLIPERMKEGALVGAIAGFFGSGIIGAIRYLGTDGPPDSIIWFVLAGVVIGAVIGAIFQYNKLSDLVPNQAIYR